MKDLENHPFYKINSSLVRIKHLLCICCFFAFLISGPKVKAQYPVLRQFTVEDGLPGGKIYYSMQDSKGYIWSATERGITCFDGNKFKLYTIEDGLPSNDVWSIKEDIEGRLWINTFADVCYFEDGEIKIFQNDKFQKNIEKVDHKFCSLGHIISFADTYKSFVKEGENVSFIANLKKDYLFSGHFYLKEDKKTAWVFKKERERLKLPIEDSLFLFDNTIIIDQNKTLEHAFIPLRNDMEECLSVSKSQAWLTIAGKMWTLKNSSFQQVDINKLLGIKKNESIIRLKKITQNKIWIGTSKQNYVVDTLFQLIPGFDFLNKISFNNILIDRQENIWLSTNHGLFFLNQKAQDSKTYYIKGKEKLGSLKFISKNKNQDIWGMSTTEYLYKLDQKKGLIQMSTNPLIQVGTDLEFDPNGNLWMAGKQLIIIPEKRLTQPLPIQESDIIVPESSNLIAIKKINFNKEQSLLASFNRVYQFEFNTRKVVKVIYKNRSYGVENLDNKQYWINGKNGLKLISEDREELMFPGKDSNPIFNLPINNIILRKDQKLWIAVNSQGVYLLDGEKLDSISELQNILVQSLCLDSNQDLWVSTNKGLAKIDQLKRDPFSYSFRWFTEANGLVSNDVKEIVIDSNLVYAATEKGLTIIKDIEKNPNPIFAPFLFSKFKINGRDTILNEDYDLNFNQNNIQIEYQCLDYQNMGSKIFQYQLEGIDQDWVSTAAFQKEYPLLPPGKYNFRIRRKPNHQHINQNELTLRFTIHPPWWKNKAFIFGSILISGLVFFLLVQRRINQIKKRATKKNKLNQKFAELELNALQSQMNPHFIFNALHAIQDFIFKKDERIANRYLVKFSRLMRLFLESSKEKFIILEDEIKLLQLYIELEQLRFEDQFVFEIKVADKLAPSMIEIPSMLLQPFVENAINHGLIHRLTPGKLLLEFSMEQKQLHCKIEDNGIGRAKAMEIKKQSVKSYKSRGMQLVEERQRIWNNIGNAPIEITIKDLYDNNEEACGTRIDLFINLGD